MRNKEDAKRNKIEEGDRIRVLSRIMTYGYEDEGVEIEF